MKLLFDHNLSYRLVQLLADIYPDSSHVCNHGLQRSADTDIWRFAEDKGYTIVSKDADFEQRALLHGFPPKVICNRSRL